MMIWRFGLFKSRDGENGAENGAENWSSGRLLGFPNGEFGERSKTFISKCPFYSS